jgi:anthranilate phosphoribosyltransferase
MLAARGQKSMFNLLGPLLNPARPDYQLVGVFDAALTEVFATILRALGRKRAWAVHGTTETGAGVDEMSTMGPTRVTESDASGLRSRTVTSADAGLPTATHDQLRGGDAAANAGILQGILAGTDRGPRRDLAVLNAAAGFVVAGLAADLPAGRALAEEVIDSGRALARLAALRQATEAV